MTTQTITVSKFNNYIKAIFNSEELLHNIKIVGEVFGVSLSKTSTYFSIKDEEASLPCVCFYGDLTSQIKEGDMVVVTGSPNFYTKSGRFNFIVNKIEPFGQGLLFQRFLEMKEKLEKEGLFSQEHKKPMPTTIKRIGVVTSKDGAVIQDIKNVTWRRNKSVDIVLYSTKVQGNDAEYEIAEGINFFSEYEGVDVVIVARGGGSMEDLAAYNTEIVARATYACQKPIVSAVGHETDFTIIDFVSDLRAPTPSAAAELLTKDSKQLALSLKKATNTLSRCMDVYISEKIQQFQMTKNTLIDMTEDVVSDKKVKIEQIKNNLSQKVLIFSKDKEFELSLKLATVKKLNPLDILAQGYAKIEQNGKPISTLKETDLKQDISINFVDGVLNATPKSEEKL